MPAQICQSGLRTFLIMQGSGSKDQGYYFAGQNIPLQLDNLKHYSA